MCCKDFENSDENFQRSNNFVLLTSNRREREREREKEQRASHDEVEMDDAMGEEG